jgi:phosphotransacetylase
MVTRPFVRQLIERVRALPPMPAAIVFPCDREALQFALSGSFAGYLAPVLVGPEKRIRDVAAATGLDISRCPIHGTADSPRAAAVDAAALARDGKVSALIKGSLHDGDLLAPVAMRHSGLRTDRRLSHAYFVDVPGQRHGLLLADAQLNVAPNLAAKKDIVLNAIDLALALGVTVPKVALLAATDTVTHAFPSTSDAAALRAMAGEAAFRGACVDGPLTADSALSPDAARANGVKSEVAGEPDVLIAPTMETALLVLRTMTGLTGGLAAGIVLGATIPIIAPARADTMEVRMACCVLAALMVAAAGRTNRGASAAPALQAIRATA